MDRRNALFAFCVLVLYGCDDGSSYCHKKGCAHDDGEKRSTWGSNEQEAGGSVVYEGTTLVSLTLLSNGIDVRDSSNVSIEEGEEEDAGVDASDASDAATYPSYSPPSYYDTTKRMEIRFVPPKEVGVHRLEDTSAFAVVCPRGRGLEYGSASCVDRNGKRTTPEKLRLTGELEILDVRTDDVASGAPSERPYELPWGWRLASTNEELRIDVRVTSKPTWSDTTSYCD